MSLFHMCPLAAGSRGSSFWCPAKQADEEPCMDRRVESCSQDLPNHFSLGFKLFVYSLFVCLSETLVIRPRLTSDLLGSSV